MAALGSSAPLVCSSLWTAGSNVYAEEVVLVPMCMPRRSSWFQCVCRGGRPGSNVYAEEVIPLLPELEGVPGDIVCVLISIYQVIMQDANEQPNEEAHFMGVANLSAQVRP